MNGTPNKYEIKNMKNLHKYPYKLLLVVKTFFFVASCSQQIVFATVDAYNYSKIVKL